jgi:hypothetical protein
MKIGDIVNYFGKKAQVVLFNTSHVVIKFEDGSRLCTKKTAINR